MAWKSDEWEKKRAQFLQHVLAPDILYFNKISYSLSKETPNVRRYIAATSMRHCAGLGSNDSPKGRREAYCEAVMPFEWDKKFNGAVAIREYTPNPESNGTSSCGTFIRGMWQLLGGGSDSAGTRTKDRYKTRMHQSLGVEEVMQCIAIFGWNCDALFGRYEGWQADGSPKLEDPTRPIKSTDPKFWDEGDVLYFQEGKDQHILTLTEKPVSSDDKTWTVATVEGGKGANGDGLSTNHPCEGVKTDHRTLRWNGKTFDLIELTLPLKYWVDFGRLDFTDPEYFVARWGPQHPARLQWEADQKAKGQAGK